MRDRAPECLVEVDRLDVEQRHSGGVGDDRGRGESLGVNAALLRAWERRYGLLQPVRSAGGFRLYTSEDAERVARMRRSLDEGLSAAEAARAALQGDRRSEGLLDDVASRLLAAIHDYDEAAVQAILDGSFAGFGLEAVLGDLILPTLARVGLEWQQGTLAVSQEHFASNLIRARLLSLARMWGRGSGPLALLACAPGEQHDISLMSFGLLLRSYGWRILFLGTDTPLATLAEAAETTGPALTVLASFDPHLLETEASALRRLARRVPLAVGGPGASDALCTKLGVRRLDGDVVGAATEIGHSASG